MSGVMNLAEKPNFPKFADQFKGVSLCVFGFTDYVSVGRPLPPAKSKGWRKHIRRQKSAVRG